MAFVTINYGDNQHLLFNPNCRTRLFIENVKERCKCPNEMEVELADEYGNLKNINVIPSRYANQVLNVERENLVLIQIKRKSSNTTTSTIDEDDVMYIPLLNDGVIVNSKFKARLSNREPESGRPESKIRKTPREKREKTVKTLLTDKRDDLTSSSSQRHSGGGKYKTSQGRSRSRGRNK